ncbi:MAG: GH25 family lysozyme [Actinomycetota bacterium]
MLAVATPADAASGSGFAGASGNAGPAAAPTAVVQPPGSLPGIDVSHYQNVIDWTQVAASGVRFAFAKATEGQHFVDPTYATNEAGAAAAGVMFGAYDFARPDATPNGAILEADHFVDVAQPQPGQLLPVLDLEKTGGLTPDELTAWTLAWLGEVASRTGVRPMVYTSPIGWANRMADTTAIADAGYTVLWVAHWNVASPTVPANDWQGFGWTFWQYSDCGSVPGITGCVDSDWFNGVAFDAVTIPSPDQTPPVASLSPPQGPTGSITASFSEVVGGVTPSNVVLHVQDTGAEVTSTRTCVGTKGSAVDCATGKVMTVVLEPTAPLVPGQAYAVIVNPAGVAPGVTDPSGNVAATTEVDFSEPGVVEQGNPAVTYGWRKVSSGGAFGSSYVVEHLPGATASFAFTGKNVTWYTVMGSTQGKAGVWIDGRPRGTFDQYASSMRFKVARTFHLLKSGPHTIVIHVLGLKGASTGTDTQVAVDAFGVGNRVLWTPELRSAWRTTHVAGASSGTVAVTDLAGSSVTLPFRGSGLTWQTVRGPDQGQAQIFVDGALVKTVDDYATTTSLEPRTISGLADGVHTLRIVVLGRSRPIAKGAKVSIDGFTVIA